MMSAPILGLYHFLIVTVMSPSLKGGPPPKPSVYSQFVQRSGLGAAVVLLMYGSLSRMFREGARSRLQPAVIAAITILPAILMLIILNPMMNAMYILVSLNQAWSMSR